MKLEWNYGHGVITLPADITNHIAEANEDALRVLLALSDPAVCTAPDIRSALVGAARMSIGAVTRGLEFWQKKGIITLTGEAEVPVAKDGKEDAAPVSRRPVIQMPQYSAEEIGNILQKRTEIADLVDVCNQLWGKMLGRAEAGKLVALLDYYSLDTAYLSEVIAFVAQDAHKSMSTVEKTVTRLFDEGVRDTKALSERLAHMRRSQDFEGQVRDLFGLQSRALTTKEKNMLSRWMDDFSYGIDMVKCAYEVNVDAIGKPALPYANAVLERWFAEGYAAPADLEKDAGKKSSADTASFETDAAFEAALRRSYGADYDRMGFGSGNAKNKP